MGGPKPLHFQIDPQSGLPVYRQMMDQVKYYLASGVLQPGDQLPSIRELAVRLSVNPTTVVKAYTELQHDGIIEMKHGKGAFMTDAAAPMSIAEQEKSLRRMARQLAVEATQLGASREKIERIIREELDRLRKSD